MGVVRTTLQFARKDLLLFVSSFKTASLLHQVVKWYHLFATPMTRKILFGMIFRFRVVACPLSLRLPRFAKTTSVSPSTRMELANLLNQVPMFHDSGRNMASRSLQRKPTVVTLQIIILDCLTLSIQERLFPVHRGFQEIKEMLLFSKKGIKRIGKLIRMGGSSPSHFLHLSIKSRIWVF
jgi:hypothetical protein